MTSLAKLPSHGWRSAHTTPGIQTAVLIPDAGDFNDDLRTHGLAWLRARLAHQLMAEDGLRFIPA